MLEEKDIVLSAVLTVGGCCRERGVGDIDIELQLELRTLPHLSIFGEVDFNFIYTCSLSHFSFSWLFFFLSFGDHL